MPKRQRGSARRHGTGWQARWYDENGDRQTRAGFRTQTEAEGWVREKVDEVEALRRGDLSPPPTGRRP